LGKKLGVNAKASHILISYEGTVPNKKKKKELGRGKQKLFSSSSSNPDSFMMLAFQILMILQHNKVGFRLF
jgi:peptidyl-prolyl cis-trans isomerase D